MSSYSLPVCCVTPITGTPLQRADRNLGDQAMLLGSAMQRWTLPSCGYPAEQVLFHAAVRTIEISHPIAQSKSNSEQQYGRIEISISRGYFMGSSDLTTITPPTGFPTAAKSPPSTENPSYDITYWETLDACKPSRIPGKILRIDLQCRAIRLSSRTRPSRSWMFYVLDSMQHSPAAGGRSVV